MMRHPNQIKRYSNKTYHERVNKTPHCKVKRGESRNTYGPVNKTIPSYWATEIIGTFSTTVNKTREVPSTVYHAKVRNPQQFLNYQ